MFQERELWRMFRECERDAEYRCALEEVILSRTTEIAKGRYSKLILRQVLCFGPEPFKDAVAKRIAEDVVSLCKDEFGRNAVDACILEANPVSTAPLQRVLTAVLALPDDQLAEVVSNHVIVIMLFRFGKELFPEQTMELARLPTAVQRVTLHAAL